MSCDDLKSMVIARNLGKCYRRYVSPLDWLRERYLSKQATLEHWALKNVSFELAVGASVGVIGNNGAGKSTLLQLIAGTLAPSSGEIERHGRVAALLELGAGFNPEFTGRENAKLNASILGLSRNEIQEKLPGIVAFSGIGDAIDRPVRTYSTGMFMRLAFSVATAVDPDILIVDEALSVGDGAFARKSFERIMEIRERGASIIFCSHTLFQVEKLCETVIWLDQGQVVRMGKSADVIREYQAFLDGIVTKNREETGRSHNLAAGYDSGMSSGTAQLLGFSMFVDGAVLPTERPSLQMMLSTLRLRIELKSSLDIPLPKVACLIEAEDKRIVTSMGNWIGDREPILRDADGVSVVDLELPAIPLLPGRYYISVILLCERGILFYETAHHCGEFQVVGTTEQLGYVNIPNLWRNAQRIDRVS